MKDLDLGTFEWIHIFPDLCQNIFLYIDPNDLGDLEKVLATLERKGKIKI